MTIHEMERFVRAAEMGDNVTTPSFFRSVAHACVFARTVSNRTKRFPNRCHDSCCRCKFVIRVDYVLPCGSVFTSLMSRRDNRVFSQSNRSVERRGNANGGGTL